MNKTKEFYENAMQEEIVKDLLISIGEDVEREGLKDTPKRVVKMFKELFRGYDPLHKPKITTFNNGSDGVVYDQMVCDEGKLHSFCEHHCLPFIGKYYFAYIPHPKGKVLGISKVARVVDYYSARLQIQERLGTQIVEELKNAVNSDTEHSALGFAICIESTHLCKTMRGVKKEGKMTTFIMDGVFKEDHVKNEFLSHIRRSK